MEDKIISDFYRLAKERLIERDRWEITPEDIIESGAELLKEFRKRLVP